MNSPIGQVRQNEIDFARESLLRIEREYHFLVVLIGQQELVGELREWLLRAEGTLMEAEDDLE